MNERWTIRNVQSEAVEIVRALSRETGKSAGRLVSEAIFAWAEVVPAEEPLEPMGASDDVATMVTDLEKQMARQTELLHIAFARLGASHLAQQFYLNRRENSPSPPGAIGTSCENTIGPVQFELRLDRSNSD